jgi:hypothetical protein
MPMVFAAGSLNWNICSTSTESIYLSTKLICERERDVLLLANNDCCRTDRSTEEGVTVILVRWGIDNYAVTVLGLNQLETTAIHIMLASGPLKILAKFLPPSRPVDGSNFSACFGGRFPVMKAGDIMPSM